MSDKLDTLKFYSYISMHYFHSCSISLRHSRLLVKHRFWVVSNKPSLSREQAG